MARLAWPCRAPGDRRLMAGVSAAPVVVVGGGVRGVTCDPVSA